MKKRVITLIAMLFVACNLISCSDDENPSVNMEFLAVECNMSSMYYDGTSKANVAGQDITTDFVGKGKNINSTMTISKNPNTLEIQGSYDVELTSTILGVSQTSTERFDDIDASATWTLDGDVLTISGTSLGGNLPSDVTIDTTSQEFTIEELTETKLRLRSVVDESQTVLGFSIEVKMETVLEFTR